MKKIDLDSWIETYKPIRKDDQTIVDTADDLDFCDLQFMVRGTDLEIVNKANPLCVWTLLECDGNLFIVSGIHFVNREAYLIASVPVTVDAEIEIEV